jgi:nicotinic acid mononucleotide adenylyltransferase
MRPIELIQADEQFPVDGSKVRLAMARGENWESLVPDSIAKYIKSNHLDDRFREEFGLQTLALETIIQ